MNTTVHRRLECGIDFAVESMPDRPTVSMDVRFRSGAAYDPPDQLGVARLVEQTVSKGTAERDGRGLSDAFDSMGIRTGSGTGRETITFRCTCLPEFVGGAIDLHAEMLRTPTFPADACEVAVGLALQELEAVEDDPGELARKLLGEQAYGNRLGRDPLGTPQTLSGLGRQQVEDYWSRHVSANRMQVAVAGAVDPDEVAGKFEDAFRGFGPSPDDAREPIPLGFAPSARHRQKDLEQDTIMICWPGVPTGHPDDPVEQVIVGILSGGMSGRLFTEVREKQGLVYWVGAWVVRPRGSGLIHVGASTTPERCDKTYETLLREIDRLAEDVDDDELRRAVTGITSRKSRQADLTQARASEIGNDLMHFGRPVPIAEKLDAVRAVTIEDIRRYLGAHPRDALSVLTLGPQALAS